MGPPPTVHKSLISLHTVQTNSWGHRKNCTHRRTSHSLTSSIKVNFYTFSSVQGASNFHLMVQIFQCKPIRRPHLREKLAQNGLRFFSECVEVEIGLMCFMQLHPVQIGKELEHRTIFHLETVWRLVELKAKFLVDLMNNFIAHSVKSSTHMQAIHLPSKSLFISAYATPCCSLWARVVYAQAPFLMAQQNSYFLIMVRIFLMNNCARRNLGLKYETVLW